MPASRVITPQEIKAISDAFGDTFTGRRDRALFALMFEKRMSLATLLRLTVGDYYLDGHLRDTFRALDPSTQAALNPWLKTLTSCGLAAPETPLALSRSGRHYPRAISRVQFWRTLQAAAARAQVPGPVNPASLIKTKRLAVYLRGNLADLQRFCGHQDIGSTAHYMRFMFEFGGQP